MTSQITHYLRLIDEDGCLQVIVTILMGKQTVSLLEDNTFEIGPQYYLNVRSNFKNYDDEVRLFLDYLCPYIVSKGFLGYMRRETSKDPTLIYKN